MSRADRITGILLFLFAAWFAAYGLKYPYWGENGPGSGFLPFWLGLVMAILAALLFLGAARPGSAGDEAWLPRGRSLGRLVAVIGATLAFILVMDRTGMILGAALFMVVALRFGEAGSWLLTLGVAAATAAGTYLVFVHWLGVPFPVGPLGF